jgi:hypothetical protein
LALQIPAEVICARLCRTPEYAAPQRLREELPGIQYGQRSTLWPGAKVC